MLKITRAQHPDRKCAVTEDGW